MTQRVAILVILALGLPLGGCEQKTEAPAPTASSSAQPAAAISDEDLAVASDFDDEAEQQIGEANYKAEIDALEKDIGAEP